MSEFSIVPDEVRAGAEAMFVASEELHSQMSMVAEETGGIAGSIEAADFTGIAEVVEAARKWESDYIAVHRVDIESLAKCAAVHAEQSEEIDAYVSSMFDAYADEYFPDGRSAPAPERPAPDPADQVPLGGESVAV